MCAKKQSAASDLILLGSRVGVTPRHHNLHNPDFYASLIASALHAQEIQCNFKGPFVKSNRVYHTD